jgi:hypothetical protein
MVNHREASATRNGRPVEQLLGETQIAIVCGFHRLEQTAIGSALYAAVLLG